MRGKGRRSGSLFSATLTVDPRRLDLAERAAEQQALVGQIEAPLGLVPDLPRRRN